MDLTSILLLLEASSPRASLSATISLTMPAAAFLVVGSSFRYLSLDTWCEGALAWWVGRPDLYDTDATAIWLRQIFIHPRELVFAGRVG